MASFVSYASAPVSTPVLAKDSSAALDLEHVNFKLMQYIDGCSTVTCPPPSPGMASIAQTTMHMSCMNSKPTLVATCALSPPAAPRPDSGEHFTSWPVYTAPQLSRTKACRNIVQWGQANGAYGTHEVQMQSKAVDLHSVSPTISGSWSSTPLLSPQSGSSSSSYDSNSNDSLDRKAKQATPRRKRVAKFTL